MIKNLHEKYSMFSFRLNFQKYESVNKFAGKYVFLWSIKISREDYLAFLSVRRKINLKTKKRNKFKFIR